jgi:hypothetical protein
MSEKELIVWIDVKGTFHTKQLDDAGATEDFFETWKEMPLVRVWNATKYGHWYTNSTFEGELQHPFHGDSLFIMSPDRVPPEVRALALLLL